MRVKSPKHWTAKTWKWFDLVLFIYSLIGTVTAALTHHPWFAIVNWMWTLIFCRWYLRDRKESRAEAIESGQSND